MFRSTNVPFDECSVRRMFHSTNVPFDECFVRRMFHSTNVPFDECSVRTNVPFDQCSFDESAFDESVFDESVVSLFEISYSVRYLNTLRYLISGLQIFFENDSLFHVRDLERFLRYLYNSILPTFD